MSKKRIYIGAAAITVVLVGAVFFWLRGAQIVDLKPPLAAADSYFSELKRGHADLSLASYSVEFRAKYRRRQLMPMEIGDHFLVKPENYRN